MKSLPDSQLSRDIATLDAFFRPASVAVVGATENAANLIASAPLLNLATFGYAGDIYAVHPSATEVHGVPAVRSVADLPGGVEAAIVVAPAPAVLDIARECEAAGIRRLTIASAGIRPADVTALTELDLRFLGPESLGVVNLVDAYVARAARNQMGPADVRTGGAAIVTRSGAMGNTLFSRAQANGVGVAYSVNTGREGDVGLWEIARWYVEQPEVSCILVVSEGIGEPAAFVEAAEAARDAQKPIVLLELGRTKAGGRAISTHSGALAGTERVHDAAYRRLAVLDVTDFDEMWQIAKLVDRWGATPLPAASRKLGVIALSGGEGAMIADQAESRGIAELEPPRPTEEQSTAFAERFPEVALQNPLDPTTRVLASHERMAELLTIWSDYGGYSDVLLALPSYGTDFADSRVPPLLELATGESLTRFALSVWAAAPLTNHQEALVRESSVCFVGPSPAFLRAYAHHVTYCDYLARAPEPSLATRASSRGTSLVWSYSDARDTLSAIGIPVPDRQVLAAPDRVAVVAAVAALGHPLVLKLDVPSGVHKASLGLVRTGLRNSEDVVAAADAVVAAGQLAGYPDALLVLEQHVLGEYELLLGGVLDPEFGATVVFGLGGRLAEAMDDVAVDLLPIDTAAVARLIRSSRAGRAIADASPAAFRHVSDAVGAFATWFAEFGPATGVAVEINPLIASATGCYAVDFRIAGVDVAVA
jgi:acyl-CoA synthetase (NDP forming)